MQKIIDISIAKSGIFKSASPRLHSWPLSPSCPLEFSKFDEKFGFHLKKYSQHKVSQKSTEQAPTQHFTSHSPFQIFEFKKLQLKFNFPVKNISRPQVSQRSMEQRLRIMRSVTFCRGKRDQSIYKCSSAFNFV